jgi:hypothetical protein
VEDLDYLEEEEGLMVAAAVLAVLAALVALVALMAAALVDVLTATMDLGAVVVAAEDSVTVTGTVKKL